jgi:hypothetical protein
MNSPNLLNVPAPCRKTQTTNPKAANHPLVPASPDDERVRQLACIAADNDEDGAECAAADRFREFEAP